MVEQIREVFPFEQRYWYPHMKPADIAIWERFIAKWPDSFVHCQYDVPCGTGPEFDTLVNPESGGHVEELYKKKIDVVAFKGTDIVLIELKPRAGAAAVGQILQYKKLYVQDYNPPTEPTCLILTDEASADTQDFARDHNVQILIV